MAADRSETAETAGMNRCGILNYIIIFLAMILAVTPSFSQTDSLAKQVNRYSPQYKTSETIHSLYSGIGAGSNLIYLGSSLSDNKPFYSASMTYGFRNSFFASASATHLNQTSPCIAFYNIAFNYSHTFNSWFDISADIAGYKAAESLHDSLFADFAYLNLTTGFDWRLIYTRVSFSGILSEQKGFYLQLSNSRYFETGEFLNGKAIVYFNPDIDILSGNKITVENVPGSKTYGKAPPFSHARKKPGNPEEVVSEKFGLIDLMFSLPVTFSYGPVSVEAETGYLIPLQSNPYYTEPEGFTFYLNIIFKIF
jgi:hypothetical protein